MATLDKRFATVDATALFVGEYRQTGENSSAGALERFRKHVINASTDPSFVHSSWYVKYHLLIVERLAEELLDLYPTADKKIVRTLVWLHDYGKVLGAQDTHSATIDHGRRRLRECGFSASETDEIITLMEPIDRVESIAIDDAPIEAKIVSTADGCSHLIGPFFLIYWQENADKPFEALMAEDRRKMAKDWESKIVLTEFRDRFESQRAALRNLVDPHVA
jgi:HD superfamily phosphodiesterase